MDVRAVARAVCAKIEDSRKSDFHTFLQNRWAGIRFLGANGFAYQYRCFLTATNVKSPQIRFLWRKKLTPALIEASFNLIKMSPFILFEGVNKFQTSHLLFSSVIS